MKNQWDVESRSVMWPDAPEPRHSVPCYHCGSGDHPDWLCMWNVEDWENECQFCGEQLTYSANGMAYCECGYISD